MVMHELFDLGILYMANLRGEVNCLVQPNLLRFDVPRCLSVARSGISYS